MKRNLLLLFVLAGTVASAQQLAQYSLVALNPYMANPAYAGLEGTLVATGVYRQQWAGLKGAPVSQHINAHLPVFAINSGVGLRVDNDAVGAHNTTAAMVNYSYQVALGRRTLISLGVGAGYMQYRLDGAKLRAPEGTYAEPGGGFSHNDSQIPTGAVQAGTPTFEAGLMLKSEMWFVGLSAQPVFAPTLSGENNGRFTLNPSRHYTFMASYSLTIGENWVLNPVANVKSDTRETQTDLFCRLHWRENIFAALGFRGYSGKSRDALIISTGFRLNEKSSIAYAFDASLSALNAANQGSHEILLRYSLNKPIGAGKLPPIIYNPRFF